jgi:hypothetical protein
MPETDFQGGQGFARPPKPGASDPQNIRPSTSYNEGAVLASTQLG